MLQWAGILLWCQKLTEHIKIILHPKLERKRIWGRYFMAVWFFNKVVWFVLAAAKTTFCLYLVKRLIVTLRCAVNVTTSSLNHFSRNLGANFVFRKRSFIIFLKNPILVTSRATNLLILRKWCGFGKPNHYFICNGNRTEWSPIRSVIILVIKQSGLPPHGRPILLITRMIRDRIGLH